MLDTGADASKPLLGAVAPQRYVYRGDEQVTVPAGTFAATHITMDGHSDIWFHGPDHLLIRYIWRDIDRDYVLKSLSRGP